MNHTSEQFEIGDLDLLARIGREALQRARTPAWEDFRRSDDAATHFRPILDEAFKAHTFLLAPRREWTFSSFWRSCDCDGLWRRPDACPRTLALEVKVNEDADAPFGQVMDDLGAFDAVLHVRLYNRESIRRRLESDETISEARERISGRLPVRFISL